MLGQIAQAFGVEASSLVLINDDGDEEVGEQKEMSVGEALVWSDQNNAPAERSRLRSRAAAFALANEVRRLRKALEDVAFSGRTKISMKQMATQALYQTKVAEAA